VLSFISNAYIGDVEYVASVYRDYYGIGKGYGNLLSFGVFSQDSGTKLLKRGRIVGGSQTVRTLETGAITEGVTYSWYSDSTDNLNPTVGDTIPAYPKNNAYSWMKAPRYRGEPYEVGPLARMWVNGNYRKGISVMDRHLARAYEARKIATAMRTWVDKIVIGGPVYTKHTPVLSADAMGLTEAPRGALGHWVQINNGKLSLYQVITPTCWNASPRDNNGTLGPIEEALIGTTVENINEPVEVLRVIHSFDPCMSCAVHMIRADEKVC
jgi:hydrogenase large subunit